MSYYTNFLLKYSYAEGFNANENDEIIRKDICHSLSRITDWMTEEDVEALIHYGCECKWYNRKSDMKELAEEFPNIHFILEGVGEDQGDIWIMDFWGDKCCERYKKIIMPNEQPLIWE